MISLQYKTQDQYCSYGISHFFQNYGIPVRINDDNDSKISIVYGDKISESEFIIRIPAEENREDEFILRILQQFEKEPGNIKSDVIYSEKGIEAGFDIFKAIGYILSGKFEDAISKFDHQQRKIFSRTPVVDIYEKMLFNLLLYACQKLDVPLMHKAFWPNDKRFAVCLTHDVDEIRKTYQYFTRSVRHLKRGEIRRAWYHLATFFTDKFSGRNPYWTFDEIMRIENALKVKSTFFFLNETAKVNVFRPATWSHYARRYDFQDLKVAKLIKELASNGWEIGLHGSYESYLNVDKLRKEKDYLEETLGSTIYGIRQHHLNLKIPETWKYQEEIGLEYDTSLGFKGGEDIGFRWGTCFPFHPYNNGEVMSLVEIPLAIMDISLTNNSDINIWKECINIVDTVEKYGGVLTLLWHHTVFNEEEYPGWAEIYERIIKVCKEKNAWIINAGEIAKWWKKREESRLECGYDNGSLKIIPYPKSQKHFIDIHLPEGKSVEVSSENAEINSKDGSSVTISTNNLKEKEEIVLAIV